MDAMAQKFVVCPYCGGRAPLVTGLDIYPHRRDLWAKKFYQCKPCDALVGCHPAAGPDGRGGHGDGTVPMGRLANADLRAAKQAAHAAFDPIWKGGHMRRRDAYAWLAKALRISPEDCHIGMFDVDQCRVVIAASHALRAAGVRPQKRRSGFSLAERVRRKSAHSEEREDDGDNAWFHDPDMGDQ